MDMIEHRVRERAYYIWEGEGRVAGRADAHWFQAQAEFAVASAEVAPVAVVSAAKAKVPARTKAAAHEAPAKAAAAKASKAAVAKAPAKPRKTPRAEVGIALH